MAPHADSRAALHWSLVIPVKVLAQAKSRLTGLAGDRRADLALAMASDTVAAAMGSAAVAAVLVVTDDPEVSRIAASLGAQVLPDLPGGGLNQALAYGADRALAQWPNRGRAGLAGDVPAASPAELTAALAVAATATGAAFVPDAEGTGTTLYAAAPWADFQPRFGPGSRQAHLATGAAEIRVAPPLTGLRRDVDTLDNLREAAAIGLGPRTAALLSADGGILPDARP